MLVEEYREVIIIFWAILTGVILYKLIGNTTIIDVENMSRLLLMFIVWFGVIATKYENITNTAPT